MAPVAISPSPLPAQINQASVLAQHPVFATLIPAYITRWMKESVPQVEDVFVKVTESVIRVWTVVDAPDGQVYDDIYNQEKRMIGELRPATSHIFDFHVVSRRGKPLASVITLTDLSR